MSGDLELESDVENKWEFPKPHLYLGTVVHSGIVRPLSPTFEEHFPELVFPGMAMLAEKFETMRKWINAIQLLGSTRAKMFDSRHHWNMRTKFLEVRLTCMDKIVEDPFAYRKHDVWFLVRVPRVVRQTTGDENRTTESDMKRNINSKERNYAKSPLGICGERVSKVEVKNFAKNELTMKEKSNKRENYSQVEIAIEGKNSFDIKNDEKLHRKSLQKKLDLESRSSETSSGLFSASREYKNYSPSGLPSTSADEHEEFYPRNESNMYISTTRNSILNQESSFKVDTELVLEDINDTDLVPEIILPSARTLEKTTPSANEVCEQNQNLSRFQRLRRRVVSLFACFGNNKVTSINI